MSIAGVSVQIIAKLSCKARPGARFQAAWAVGSAKTSPCLQVLRIFMVGPGSALADFLTISHISLTYMIPLFIAGCIVLLQETEYG